MIILIITLVLFAFIIGMEYGKKKQKEDSEEKYNAKIKEYEFDRIYMNNMREDFQKEINDIIRKNK